MASPAASIACERLQVEHAKWKVVRPQGFEAVITGAGASAERFLQWDCSIPVASAGNKSVTARLTFTLAYPFTPPTCVLRFPLLHPNVFPSGKVDLPLFDNWAPTTTVEDVLVAVQKRLDNPDFQEVANPAAAAVHRAGKAEFAQNLQGAVARWDTKLNW